MSIAKTQKEQWPPLRSVLCHKNEMLMEKRRLGLIIKIKEDINEKSAFAR
jgi:hypothetical protein